MIGFRVDKSLFFDRQKVQNLAGKQGAAFLNRAGGFIRTTARRSMRSGGKKRKASSPGMPPRYHTKDKTVTLRNIQYFYSPVSQSVVIGPIGLNQKQYLNGRLSAGTVPALHEFGGTAGLREQQITVDRKPKWVPVGRRKPRQGTPTRVRTAKYPARPFMAPALAKAREKFPTLWYGSVNAA